MIIKYNYKLVGKYTKTEYVIKQNINLTMNRINKYKIDTLYIIPVDAILK